MKKIIIAAHDPNLVIGKNGELPWHYSEDLKFFKKQTMGSPIIMGRVVFEELNEKPLPGRVNVVLSKSREYDHVHSFSDIDSAFSHLTEHEKVFIIGGGEVYKQLLDSVDQLIITEIKKEFDGDTFFPEYRDQVGTIWKEIWRESHPDFDFVIYDRV
jgi:dihydrofolate reductase